MSEGTNSVITTPLVLRISTKRSEVKIEGAVGLIKSLAALDTLFALEILAYKGTFEFRIVASKHLRHSVENAIYSFFPNAQITEGIPIHTLTDSYWVSPIATYCRLDQNLYWAPILSARDIKNIDPLAIILQPMSGLKKDEFIALQFLVRKEQHRWHSEFEKHLQKPFLTINRMSSWIGGSAKWTTIKALVDMGRGEKEPRFEQDIQHDLMQKLRQPLLEVTACLVLGVPEDEKRSAHIKSLDSAFEHFSVGYSQINTFSPDNETWTKISESIKQYAFNINSPGWFSETPSDDRLMILTVDELAALWHFPTVFVQTPGLQTIPTVEEEEAKVSIRHDGVILGMHEYQGRKQPVILSNTDRQGHMMVVGKTDTGKSTFLHHLIHQDIQSGRGIAVIDPTGKLVNDILEQSIPIGREKDVVVFDIADREYPVGLGFFSLPPNATAEQKEKAVNHIVGVFKRIFADNWSPTRMENALSATVATLIEVPGATLMDIIRLFTDEQFRYSAIDRVKDAGTKEFWYGEFEHLGDRDRREMLRPILTRIRRFYHLSTIRNITCQQRNLDIYSIINSGKIFLASMDGAGEDSDESHLGALLVSKFQIAGMSRSVNLANVTSYYLYVDEVQHFVTTSLKTVFSEARKYGLSMAVANQYLHQLKDDTLESIMGNVGAMVIFQCGARDASTLESETKPMFKADDIANRSPHEAIIKMRVEKSNIPAFLIKTLPPLKARNKERARMLRELSRTIYATKKEEIEQQLTKENQSMTVEDFEEPA